VWRNTGIKDRLLAFLDRVQFDLNQKGDKAHNDGMTHRKPESSLSLDGKQPPS
jgi:hypothetical protein